MPWGISKETTVASLKNKSIEARKVFAEVANKSLAEGKTEEESVFAGLAAVANLERKKSKELKKAQEEQQIKDSHIPEHLKLLQEAQEIKKQKKLEDALQEESALREQVLKFVGSEYKQSDISEMLFDNTGKLVIKYSDGNVIKTKNAIPEEVVNKYISVSAPPINKSLEPVTTLNGSSPEIVFLSNGDIVMQQVILED